MTRTLASCIAVSEKALYPNEETLLFFTDGESEDLSPLTIDGEQVLHRTLSPVNALDVLITKQEIFLHTIEFCGYDTSLKNIENTNENSEGEGEGEGEGEEGEEGEEENDKEYANELVIGNMLTASWQPNYFKPIVRLNGSEIVSNISTPNPSKVDYSKAIGLPIPFCLSINKVIKNPKSIDIIAALAQRTPAGYRNYPVLAVVSFWHNEN
jgi:hypothetical protein